MKFDGKDHDSKKFAYAVCVGHTADAMAANARTLEAMGYQSAAGEAVHPVGVVGVVYKMPLKEFVAKQAKKGKAAEAAIVAQHGDHPCVPSPAKRGDDGKTMKHGKEDGRDE